MPFQATRTATTEWRWKGSRNVQGGREFHSGCRKVRVHPSGGDFTAFMVACKVTLHNLAQKPQSRRHYGPTGVTFTMVTDNPPLKANPPCRDYEEPIRSSARKRREGLPVAL